jgi:hypothetical protein
METQCQRLRLVAASLTSSLLRDARLELMILRDLTTKTTSSSVSWGLDLTIRSRVKL